MFIDAREMNDGAMVQTTVCVIGGGVAGITIALELDKHGIATCLLESGGFSPDDQTRDLYRGENGGLPYSFADGSRSRFLGGSSNCWGGWCRPWDAWEFEKREWVPFSGWPFSQAELNPYFERVHEILQINQLNYDPAFWEATIAKKDVCRLPLTSGTVRDLVCQFSPPTRFGKVYRATLEHSSRVSVYLYANAVDLETDSGARNVTRVHVRTLTGRAMKVSARLVILATGGIENARLLLASNKTQTTGLGNSDDLVGRFFMDHPRLFSGNVILKAPWTGNTFYDTSYHGQNPVMAGHGMPIAAALALMPQVVKRERLLGCHVWLSSLFPGEGTKAAEALRRINHALFHMEPSEHSPYQDLATLMANPIDTLNFVYSRLFRPKNRIKSIRFHAIVEPEPNPDSRITLSHEKDALGMNRVHVMWKLGPAVQRTFDRTIALVADELKKAGVADVTLDPTLEGESWPSGLQGTWHHMGTTRMHDSPQYGVVDRNCRVHSMENLYIAGSSVFPTAGTNYPTITLTALALRLSDHVANELRRETEVRTRGIPTDSRVGEILPVPVAADADRMQV